MKRNVWYTPDGTKYALFSDALEQAHVLIAGETGSGKSVLINGLISNILLRPPVDRAGGAFMILVDPKRVELADYANVPHTLCHASGFDPDAWKSALNRAVTIMDLRYQVMQQNRQKMYTGGDLYVIIDEWANVYKNGGADCYRAVMRLTSEGRAARVHVLLATQVPKVSVLPSEVRDNMSARFCLRTASAVQSRVIMEQTGCELLPDPKVAGEAHGWYKKGFNRTLYRIPYVPQSELDRLVSHWEAQTQRKGFFRKSA